MFRFENDVLYRLHNANGTDYADSTMGRIYSNRVCSARQIFCTIWEMLTEKMSGLGYQLEPSYTGMKKFDATTNIRVSSERWADYENAFAAFEENRGING